MDFTFNNFRTYTFFATLLDRSLLSSLISNSFYSFLLFFLFSSFYCSLAPAYHLPFYKLSQGSRELNLPGFLQNFWFWVQMVLHKSWEPKKCFLPFDLEGMIYNLLENPSRPFLRVNMVNGQVILCICMFQSRLTRLVNIIMTRDAYLSIRPFLT